MNMSQYRVAFVCVIVCFLTVPASLANDWPSWRGARAKRDL